MAKKMNVESFNLDHTKVKAPYIRLVGVTLGANGDKVYKYDIRFKQPNQEHMDMSGLHSIEHLMAENIRDHMDNVLDIGPMGCQTGFYLAILNNDNYEKVLDALEKTLQDVLKATEVPACNEVQCGWAANHSLEGAQAIAKDMLAEKDEWQLGKTQRGRLAGGADRDYAFGALGDMPVDQFFEAVPVDTAVGMHGRDQCHHAATELCAVLRQRCLLARTGQLV